MVKFTHRSARCGLGAVLVAGLVMAASPAFADKDDLSLLPVDSEVVGGLDFQQLQSSTLWQQLVGPAMAKNDVQKSFNEFRTTCGVDPMKVVTKIAFGVKNLTANHPDGVFIAHGVPKAKLVACYDKMSKKKSPGQNITRDGDILFVKDKGNMVAFTFVDNNTAIAVTGPSVTRSDVKRIAKGGSALRKSRTFVDIYKKTNTRDTLWMIMNGSSKVFNSMASLGFKPQAVFGSLNVTKDLTLDMRMRMKNAAAASNFAKTMNTQAAAAATMLDKLSITANGTDVHIDILLTDKKLKALARQFGPMLGRP